MHGDFEFCNILDFIKTFGSAKPTVRQRNNMSGIFGIFNRNGNPVNKKIAEDMLDSMSEWDPDERDLWIDDSVALGHAMLWNTPESKYEYLPVHKGAYILTMDARIDNRDELAMEVELPDRPMGEIGDSEFILGAYKKWGEECPKYLLGDFAFAIWDGKKKQIFCARDHVGIKPFYYHLDDEKFIFANDIEPILKVHGISQDIKDEAVINFFTFRQLKDSKITFFKDIIKLEAATTLTIDITTEKKRTYWRIEDAPKIYFDTEEEYIDRLKELLTESIECRSRSDYPVASHLSGGLDSSAIAIIASRYLQKQNKKLSAYNWVHSPTEEENKDDFDFSMSYEISKNEKIHHQYIDFTSQDLLDVYLNHDIRFNDTLILWYEHFLRQKAHNDKVRTMLSGWGGDELISSNGVGYLTGLFWKGHIWKSCKEMYKFSNNRTKNVSYIKFLYAFFRRCINYLILPKLPFQLYCKYTGMDCDQFDYGQTLTKEYKQIRNKLNLEGQKEITSIGQNKNQIDLFNHGHLLTRIESWASGGIRNNIDYRYPLLDKRIIELALGIPEELFFKYGENRYIFKKALSGTLPEKLCWRANTKFEPNRLRRLQYVSQVMIDKWENSDYEIQVEHNKYIDKEELKKVIKQLNEFLT